MTRWHASTCAAPDVAVVDGLPLCRACNARPELEPAAHDQQQRHQRGSPGVPPDEGPGTLDLWWPPSVEYDRPPDGRELSPSSYASPRTSGGTLSVGQAPPPEPAKSAMPHLYPEPLRPDQLRLICLDATESSLPVVHVTLETYTDTACPEYETVSYTWGGEQGDSSLAHAVYVGPYWDFLMLTENCLALLRYLRPGRFGRMIWIDAICIDQSSSTERSSQVAKIRTIYEQCSRVVVFLGPDTISPRSAAQQYRHRRPLHQLDLSRTSAEVDGKEPESEPEPEPQPQPQPEREATPPFSVLLQRRYFRRVWVIQELVLSPRAMIPLGDVEFWADATTGTHWNAQWGSTTSVTKYLDPAPWLQYVSKRSFGRRGIMEILEATGDCQAGDMRDRVFGVLGLAPEGVLPDLRPDYSISHRHFSVGLFAYCMLHHRRFDFLMNAPKAPQPDAYPSWVPHWTAERRWRDLFANPVIKKARNFLDYIRESFEGYSYAPCFLDVLEWSTPPPPATTGGCREEGRHCELGKLQRHHGIKVNARTGALSIHLTKLFTFPTQAVEVGAYKGYEVFRVSVDNTASARAIYLLSNCALSAIISPRWDALYCLAPDAPDCPPIYLVLRQQAHSSTFKLVASVKLLVSRRPKDWPPPVSWQALTYSVYDLLLDFRRSVSTRKDQMNFLQLFLQDYTPTGLLCAYATYLHLQAVLEGDWLGAPDVEHLYLEQVDPKYSAKLSAGYVEFIIKPEPTVMDEGTLQPRHAEYWRETRLPWEWLEGSHKWRRFPASQAAAGPKPNFRAAVPLRISTRDLRHWFYDIQHGEPRPADGLGTPTGRLSSTSLASADSLESWIRMAKWASDRTGEAVFDLLTRTPLMRDRFYSCHRWNWDHDMLVEAFQMDGCTYRVSII